MNLNVYLMRHGQTDPENPWRYLGQRELPLSDEGRAQAARWRDALSGVEFAGAWCSDLGRCRDTAAIVLEGRELVAVPVPGLREISLGEWDGLTVAEVKSRYPGLYEARGADIAGFRPPGGESFADLSGRAWGALEQIQVAAASGESRDATLLVVGHAGMNRAIMAQLLGMPLENLFRLGQDHGCLNIVSITPGGARLTLLNGQPKL